MEHGKDNVAASADRCDERLLVWLLNVGMIFGAYPYAIPTAVSRAPETRLSTSSRPAAAGPATA